MAENYVNPLYPPVENRVKDRALARVRKKETAAIKAVPSGICPACKQRMKNVLANKIESHVCYNCRVVLPRPDGK